MKIICSTWEFCDVLKLRHSFCFYMCLKISPVWTFLNTRKNKVAVDLIVLSSYNFFNWYTPKMVQPVSLKTLLESFPKSRLGFRSIGLETHLSRLMCNCTFLFFMWIGATILCLFKKRNYYWCSSRKIARKLFNQFLLH